MKPVKFGYREEDELSTIARVETVVIRVKTDSSVVGFGEAGSIASYLNHTMGGLLDWLEAYADALVGADPLNLHDINQRIDKVSGESPPGSQPARAAIDMAMHDIVGKARGVPVYDLLGGAYRTELELLTNLYEETPDEKAAAARRFVGQGFAGLKVKIGDSIILDGRTPENLEYEKQKLLAVLRSVGSEIYVDADANQSWANAGQVRGIFASILDEAFYGNLSLEQPLHHLNLKGHVELRDTLPIPIILDESVVSPEAVMQIAILGAADRIVVKVSRVGGLQRARQIVDICESAAIGVSIDTMPFTKLGDAAHCHLAATIRDHYPIDAEGHLWFERTPFVGGFTIADGRAVLGDEPGLGVDLDEEALAALAIDPQAVARDFSPAKR
ncbi:MAG: mandelate racemase/muconate lactonizing enzyme family protein [Hyphomicrobiales bacterium]|nr:mandelate racemase/muconate lactonizing enzyme family protein [Hyphomicrobiales bacterium]